MFAAWDAQCCGPPTSFGDAGPVCHQLEPCVSPAAPGSILPPAQHSTAQHGSAEGWEPPFWVPLLSRQRGGAWTPGIDTGQDIAMPLPRWHTPGSTSLTPLGSQHPSGQGEQSSSRTCGFEMLTGSGSKCVALPCTREGANPISAVTVETHPLVHQEEHQAVRAHHLPLASLPLAAGSGTSQGHQAVPRAPFSCLHLPGCQAAVSHRAT